MPSSSIATILTPRLHLTAATRGDAWELWELWNRPLVRDALFGPAPLSIDAAMALVQACVLRSPGLWIVRSPLSTRLLGCVSLCGWPCPEFDPLWTPAAPESAPELSLAMLPSVWGRGYGFEAASAVIEQAMRDAAVDVVRATSRRDDASGQSLLYRLGFRRTAERMSVSGPCIDWSLQAPIFFALLRARTRLAQQGPADRAPAVPTLQDSSDDFLDTDVMLDR
jgi:RimJ/RimL family protein N-acetyltransferase